MLNIVACKQIIHFFKHSWNVYKSPSTSWLHVSKHQKEFSGIFSNYKAINLQLKGSFWGGLLNQSLQLQLGQKRIIRATIWKVIMTTLYIKTQGVTKVVLRWKESLSFSFLKKMKHENKLNSLKEQNKLQESRWSL